MIVVDTSALLAILLAEPLAERCAQALASAHPAYISAATVAEALIVAERRGIEREMERMIQRFGFEIVPVTADAARRVAMAYAEWGKGRHSAGLNFGDCFAYALARELDCPLLFVGDDFSRTDLANALAP